MSGPLIRLFAQVVVTGASVASKAFAQAYQQAVHNAKASGGAKQAAENLTKKMSRRMDKGEARAILNIEENYTADLVEKRFVDMFGKNDADQGGSFYLQSKIYHAKESLMEEFEKTEEAEGSIDKTTDGTPESAAQSEDSTAESSKPDDKKDKPE